MNSTPILKSKHAVVFGAGGSIGAAAEEFAKEGAEVFLSGRSKPSVEAVAKKSPRTVAGRTRPRLIHSMMLRRNREANGQDRRHSRCRRPESPRIPPDR